MSIDQFLDRRYDLETSNCLHLAADVWQALVGQDITAKLNGIINGITREHVVGFEWLSKPTSPCLVLMRRKGLSALQNRFHIGVYLDRRIIHINEQGPQFQPVDVATYGFNDIRYCR